MKRFMLLLASLLAMFFMNSLVFAQDTTLVVTSDGKVGIGTTIPQATLEVHGAIVVQETGFTGNAAGAGGGLELRGAPGTFAPGIAFDNGTQQWNIVSWEDNSLKFVKGTGSTFTPFTINNNSFQDALVLASDGVGIGTDNPQQKLHVAGGYIRVNGLGNEQAYIGGDGAGGDVQVGSFNAAVTNFAIWNEATGTRMNLFAKDIFALGNVGIGTTSPNHPLEMASGAHVTAGGVWTDASSRELKMNIRDLTGAEAARALAELAPKRYNYKAEKSEEYLGFIAEDVPELVATGNRKSLSPMDIVAVLTKVLQGQQKKIAELEARLNSME